MAEECDDGNIVGGDGCSMQCLVECGPECYPGVTLVDRCGDGFLRVGVEACDDGNTMGGDGCSSDCHLEPECNGACTARCGDFVVEPGAEECDDGNLRPGDGCSPDCTIEAGWTCLSDGMEAASHCEPLCGDAMVAPGESCDPAPEPVDYGLGGCTAVCTLSAFCGDGIVQSAYGEECDAGVAGNLGEYGGGCTVDCHFGPRCGDGRINVMFGEQCDPGACSAHDCSTDCALLVK